MIDNRTLAVMYEATLWSLEPIIESIVNRVLTGKVAPNDFSRGLVKFDADVKVCELVGLFDSSKDAKYVGFGVRLAEVSEGKFVEISVGTIEDDFDWSRDMKRFDSNNWRNELKPNSANK